ncbi:MAG: hypothetical protein KKD21_12885 [Proteobacteria bacterium]|nr:hypothetical protein [Pseudomonadota bacterium]MBU1697914.1 hypothetical protein [Pseudomonadota bacterium]
METVSNNQIEKLIEDISSIKLAISQNKKLIRLILLPTHFKWSYLLLGFSLICFSLVFNVLIEHYGSFSSIPDGYKRAVYFVIVLDLILTGVFRIHITAPSLLKIDKRFTLTFAIKEIFSFGIMHVFSPLLILVIFVGIFLEERNASYYLIPTISISMGLLHNYIGSITRLWQWLICGYWFIATGLYLLQFGPVSIPFAVSISLGCGCILLGVIGLVPQTLKKV